MLGAIRQVHAHEAQQRPRVASVQGLQQCLDLPRSPPPVPPAQPGDGEQVVLEGPALEDPQPPQCLRAASSAQAIQRQSQRGDQARRGALAGDAGDGLVVQQRGQALAELLGGAGAQLLGEHGDGQRVEGDPVEQLDQLVAAGRRDLLVRRPPRAGGRRAANQSSASSG